VRASIRTLAPEALEQALSLDSRFGRTFLGLLLRPGRVTADYLAGRRARYSSPVNFYLLASFLFFLVDAVTPEGRGPVKLQTSETREEVAQAIEEAKADLPPEAQAALERARAAVQAGQTPATGAHFEGLDRIEAWLRTRTWPGPLLADRVHEVGQLPPNEALRRLRVAFAQNAPRVLFFLVPVMALCLKLLWRRRFYAEHLVFSLHVQSLAYLSFLPGLVLPSLAAPSFLAALAWTALALRRVYGGGWGAVLAKGAVVFATVAIALGLGLAVTALVALVAM
jgi:hypothetical protein